jgi:hypothetical protein
MSETAGTNFNSRVTEPHIREVAAALDGLKELLSISIGGNTTLINEKAVFFEKLMREADLRYQQRFEAQERDFDSKLEQTDLRHQQRWEAREQDLNSRLESLDQRSVARFERMAGESLIRFAASEQALLKVDTATEKRFEGVNEFRLTLSDQAAHLMPKDEANSKFESFDKRMEKVDIDIRALREFRSGATVATEVQSSGQLQNRNAFEFNFTTIIALAGLLMGILVYFTRH